jgi:hypothetical protein
VILSSITRIIAHSGLCPVNLVFDKSAATDAASRVYVVQAALDGAYFGTTFSHLFLLTHPDLIPSRPEQSYVPRIYGFRISKESAYYQQQEERDARNKARKPKAIERGASR